MAIKAIFVGINKHLDTTIPELSGARRDATALWALFTDTVDSLSARLLVDEAATHAQVSRAMLGTLTAAEKTMWSSSPSCPYRDRYSPNGYQLNSENSPYIHRYIETHEPKEKGQKLLFL